MPFIHTSEFAEQSSNPSTPSSGTRRIFPKSDGWYDEDDNGTVTKLGAGSATDSDAIHDNVASEISAITEKATPVSADLILIEDSEDSNNKKRVEIGNLPSGGGSFSSFDLAADSGTAEQVDDAETVTIAGGDGIQTTISATNTVTIDVVGSLITALTEDTAPDKSADYILSYDASATALKKILLETILAVDCGVQTYASTAQTTSSGVATSIEFDEERKDTHGFHDNVTNPERHTVPTGYGGVYDISAHLRVGAPTTFVRAVSIVHVRSATATQIAIMQMASGMDTVSISTMYDLLEGDYIELRFSQSSGVDIDTVVVGNYSAEFRMQRKGYYYG